MITVVSRYLLVWVIINQPRNNFGAQRENCPYKRLIFEHASTALDNRDPIE